jgi:copper homeostasis protein
VNVLLEVCADSVEHAVGAERAGAARIELCDFRVDGGATPDESMLARCRDLARLPLHVLIRPRGGRFVFSPAETEAMLRDIATARRLGADGVVVGALREDGSVDVEQARVLVDAARPMSITFHRAFDVCPDPAAALESLIALGVDRVLTSGGAPTAEEGIGTLAALVRQGAGRIGILAAGTIRAGNVRRIVEETGVREVHARVGEGEAGEIVRRLGG